MSGAGAGEREARSSRRPSPLRATVPVQVWTTGVCRASGAPPHAPSVFIISVLVLNASVVHTLSTPQATCASGELSTLKSTKGFAKIDFLVGYEGMKFLFG
ncbi:hypothetical protein E2C01_012327 [Portunus trituberculatus]|uniref:Uncharacterized protein n=1 Tax=Portunus trituberculatus TaxID=210409 RepID=A0A5B7DDB9_PORTR|nr:hypothetical protein [Portunus trituberculatus]